MSSHLSSCLQGLCCCLLFVLVLPPSMFSLTYEVYQKNDMNGASASQKTLRWGEKEGSLIWFSRPRFEFSFDLREIRWISRTKLKEFLLYVVFFQNQSLSFILFYSKASRYTASSCTDLDSTRFWIGSKKPWDARFLINCYEMHVFWEERILMNIFFSCTDFGFKVHMFWEGHKIMWNLQLNLNHCTYSQK